MDESVPAIPVTFEIDRQDERTSRTGAPWRVGFAKVFDEHVRSTNVEWLTEDELRTLGAQIDAVFTPKDGVKLGEYTWSRNIDGKNTGRWQVVLRINDRPGLSLWASYSIVLEVHDEWQARAIAAILNDK